MDLHRQFQLSGWLIIVVALLMNGMNILVNLGVHDTLIQVLSGIGFTGLIFAYTIIHLAQARRCGVLGLLAFLISVISLFYSNVVTFLTLAELSGLEGASQTLLAIWDPIMHTAAYGYSIGLILFGISIARAGVFPVWAGILSALGIALQLPAQFTTEMAGPLFLFFTIGGSLLFGAGLIRIGWALASGRSWNTQEPGLSPLDRRWGGPVVIFTGLMLAADAVTNMIGKLSLASSATHIASYTAILLTAFLLYAAHGEHVSWAGFAGFFLIQFGAAFYIVTAYLITGQLAGLIDDNRMLMASWQDIPVGRAGSYMCILGMFLLGVEAIRSGVFPRWSGWLVLLGIALAFPFTFTIQDYFLGTFWVIGAIVQGIGFAWMGWSMMTMNSLEEKEQLIEKMA